jgi:hypothetical protein
MGCWFTKKDPSQSPSELNDIHLIIKNKPTDGQILSENSTNNSRGNGLLFFCIIFSRYLFEINRW